MHSCTDDLLPSVIIVATSFYLLVCVADRGISALSAGALQPPPSPVMLIVRTGLLIWSWVVGLRPHNLLAGFSGCIASRLLHNKLHSTNKSHDGCVYVSSFHLLPSTGGSPQHESGPCQHFLLSPSCSVHMLMPLCSAGGSYRGRQAEPWGSDHCCERPLPGGGDAR